MLRETVRFMFIGIVTCVFMIACGASGMFGGGNARTLLSETVWVLQVYGPEGNPTKALPDGGTTMEFDFEQGQAGGSGGCNHYSSDFEIQGEALTFSPAVSTLMACSPQEIMDQETSFHQLLPDVERFEVEGGTLTLFTGNGQVLVFSAQ